MKSKPEIADVGTIPAGDGSGRVSDLDEAIGEELSGQAARNRQPHDPDPTLGQASPTTHAYRVRLPIWATRELLASAMPPGEILAILRTNDPDVVRRHVELHLERLDEQHAERRRSLTRAGRLLSLNIARRMYKAHP